jgi:hypothetical protein
MRDPYETNETKDDITRKNSAVTPAITSAEQITLKTEQECEQC